ncbi:hypothetical protein [Streptomyces sp. NPDC002044]
MNSSVSGGGGGTRAALAVTGVQLLGDKNKDRASEAGGAGRS